MTHVFDVVKLGLTSTSKTFIYQATKSGNRLRRADDNGPNIQEPDEVKVSRPVLKQRRGGDAPVDCNIM